MTGPGRIFSHTTRCVKRSDSSPVSGPSVVSLEVMSNPLDEKLARFEELERQLVDPEVLASPARLTAVVRERGSLAKLATKYRRFKELNDQIRETMEMAEGPTPSCASWPRASCRG